VDEQSDGPQAATLPNVLEPPLPSKVQSVNADGQIHPKPVTASGISKTACPPKREGIVQRSAPRVKQEQGNNNSKARGELQRKAKGKNNAKKVKSSDFEDECLGVHVRTSRSWSLLSLSPLILILVMLCIDSPFFGDRLCFNVGVKGVNMLNSGLADLWTGKKASARVAKKRSKSTGRGELKPLSSKCNCQDEHAWKDQDGESCWAYRTYIDNGIASRGEVCEIEPLARKHCKRTCRICSCKGDDMDMEKILEPTRESLLSLYRLAIQHPEGVEENADPRLINAADTIAQEAGYAPLQQMWDLSEGADTTAQY